MGSGKARSGGVGIMATVILMFSIVMFVGSMFWLMTQAGFIYGGQDTKLFTPATNTVPITHTLNQTISTLQDSGCIVTSYIREYQGGYVQVSYEVFIEEAVTAKFIYKAENFDEETVLIVENKGKTIEWVPES